MDSEISEKYFANLHTPEIASIKNSVNNTPRLAHLPPTPIKILDAEKVGQSKENFGLNLRQQKISNTSLIKSQNSTQVSSSNYFSLEKNPEHDPFYDVMFGNREKLEEYLDNLFDLNQKSDTQEKTLLTSTCSTEPPAEKPSIVDKNIISKSSLTDSLLTKSNFSEIENLDTTASLNQIEECLNNLLNSFDENEKNLTPKHSTSTDHSILTVKMKENQEQLLEKSNTSSLSHTCLIANCYNCVIGGQESQVPDKNKLPNAQPTASKTKIINTNTKHIKSSPLLPSKSPSNTSNLLNLFNLSMSKANLSNSNSSFLSSFEAGSDILSKSLEESLGLSNLSSVTCSQHASPSGSPSKIRRSKSINNFLQIDQLDLFGSASFISAVSGTNSPKLNDVEDNRNNLRLTEPIHDVKLTLSASPGMVGLNEILKTGKSLNEKYSSSSQNSNKSSNCEAYVSEYHSSTENQEDMLFPVDLHSRRQSCFPGNLKLMRKRWHSMPGLSG